MPRRTLLTAIATIAVMVAILAFHPSDQIATVRRAIGLGQERVLPAPSVVRNGGSFSYAMTQPGDDSEPGGVGPVRGDPLPGEPGRRAAGRARAGRPGGRADQRRDRPGLRGRGRHRRAAVPGRREAVRPAGPGRHRVGHRDGVPRAGRAGRRRRRRDRRAGRRRAAPLRQRRRRPRRRGVQPRPRSRSSRG